MCPFEHHELCYAGQKKLKKTWLQNFPLEAAANPDGESNQARYVIMVR